MAMLDWSKKLAQRLGCKPQQTDEEWAAILRTGSYSDVAQLAHCYGDLPPRLLALIALARNIKAERKPIERPERPTRPYLDTLILRAWHERNSPAGNRQPTSLPDGWMLLILAEGKSIGVILRKGEEVYGRDVGDTNIEHLKNFVKKMMRDADYRQQYRMEGVELEEYQTAAAAEEEDYPDKHDMIDSMFEEGLV